jgi:hypothetical protein
MRRLDEQALAAALNETVYRLAASSRAQPEEGESAATVAVDATGLAPGALSTFYVRRTHNRGGGEPMLWPRWLKWLIVVDTKRQVLLAQEACSRVLTTALGDAAPANRGCPREVAPLGVVLADAEFDSDQNHRHVHERLGAVSVIPAKRGKATWRLGKATAPKCPSPFRAADCIGGGRW